MRHICEEGLQILQHLEDLRLRAYQDSGGVWTIGWGHTGDDVYEGLEITEREAVDFLDADLSSSERCVDHEWPQHVGENIFAAGVIFCFNVGCGAFRKSTLNKLVQEGDPGAALKEFIKWHHAGGKDCRGLIRRRIAEAQLFVTRDAEEELA